MCMCACLSSTFSKCVSGLCVANAWVCLYVSVCVVVCERMHACMGHVEEARDTQCGKFTAILSSGSCTTGSVRLQAGTSTSGRVEICNNNVWGTVCDDAWGNVDARVVCVQLGLPSSSECTNWLTFVLIFKSYVASNLPSTCK